MFIILVLIVLVAAFGIVSTLIMVVMEKNKDIAILKSMGATAKSILRIFIFEGLIIGVVGTILGLIGGYAICMLLAKYQFISLPRDVYYISRLPVKMNGIDFFLVALAAMGISFWLPSILPGRPPDWTLQRPCAMNERARGQDLWPMTRHGPGGFLAGGLSGRFLRWPFFRGKRKRRAPEASGKGTPGPAEPSLLVKIGDLSGKWGSRRRRWRPIGKPPSSTPERFFDPGDRRP